jgi:hypothetical protein
MSTDIYCKHTDKYHYISPTYKVAVLDTVLSLFPIAKHMG